MRSSSVKHPTESMRSVWKYKAEAAAEHKQASSSSIPPSLHPALQAAVEGRLGVTFSGAGFGAAYQLGAAQVLQQLGLLGSHTPVAGELCPDSSNLSHEDFLMPHAACFSTHAAAYI